MKTEKFDSLATGAFSTTSMLTAMLDHPTFAVAAVRDGRIRRANASWDALFAVRADVSVEAHIVTLFPNANSADRFERALQPEFRAGVARLEHMLVRRDGVPFMAEIVVHLLVDANPFDADAIWQVRDITAERELRREIRELEEYYRALSAYQADLTFVVDREFNVSFASPSVERALGHRAHGTLGEPFVSLLHPEDAGAAEARLVDALEKNAQSHDSFRLRMQHRDGAYRVLSCRQRNCLDIALIAGIVVNARDVTEEVDEERQRGIDRARGARLHEKLFDLATAIATSFDARINDILRAATEALGVSSIGFWRRDATSGPLICRFSFVAPASASAASSAQRVTDPLGQVFAESDSPEYAREIHKHRPIVVDDVRAHATITPAHLARLQAAGVGAMLDFPVTRDAHTVGLLSVNQAGGARAWQRDEIDFVAGISLLIALAVEGQERESAAARSEFLALHDGLTGLVNRPHAEHEVARLVAAAKKRGDRVALLKIDLDLFREVNDGFGPAVGDALLVAVAKVLTECAGADALVARSGGDEFLVVLPDADRVTVESLVQRVLDRLGGEPLVAGVEQETGASIGVATYPVDGDDAETLLSNVDIALYEAKSRGRNQAFTFNPKLAERTRLQRDLEVEIRDAIANNEFCMFYQPQLDLEQRSVIGLEALLRWQHPKRGLLLPLTFMAAAQHRGMIDTITKWALTEVCEQIVAWQRAGGLPDVPISVNITGRQFHDRRLPAIVAGALMKSGLAARNLILEVTEESLIENDSTTERVITELSRVGVRIAIDDFGVGYSSLNYLRRLLVSQIKLDRAFISGLPDDVESGAIVAAVIDIARRLKYQVIAEGIETKEQLEHLQAIGCEAGQGFYFGAPLSAVEIRKFLVDHAAARAKA